MARVLGKGEDHRSIKCKRPGMLKDLRDLRKQIHLERLIATTDVGGVLEIYTFFLSFRAHAAILSLLFSELLKTTVHA